MLSLRDCVSGMLAVGFVLAAQSIVADNDVESVQVVLEADEKIMQCLPGDVGTRSIIWLEEKPQGLTMNCEKHQKADFGMVSKHKPNYISMLVPVVVD